MTSIHKARGQMSRAVVKGAISGPSFALAVVLTAAFALLAFAQGESSARQSYLPALLLFSVLAFGCVCRWPQQAFLLLLLLGATVFPQTVGAFSLGGVRTDLLEVLCFSLIGAWALRMLIGSKVMQSPVSAPLLAFVGTAFLGAIVAVSHGATRGEVQGPLKTFLFYLLPLPLAHFFRDRGGRDALERMVLVLAWLGGLVVLATAATGFALPSGAAIEEAVVGGTRFREPLLALSVLALFLLCAKVTRERVSWWITAQMGLQAVVILLSYNRSTVVPVVLALLLFLWTRPGERRPLRGLTVLVAASLVLSGLLGAARGNYLGPEGHSIYERMVTVLDPQVFKTASYQDRASENQSARRAISQNPVFGVGLGRPYGAKRLHYLPNPPRIITYQRTFIHNAYLGVWLNLGLPGLLALLWLAARVAFVASTVWRRANDSEAPRELAAFFALLAFGIQALFAASLTSRPTILAVCACLVFLTYPGRRSPRNTPRTSLAMASPV